MADSTADPPTVPPPSPPLSDGDTDIPLTTLFEPNEECICDFGDIIINADDGFHPPQKLRVSSCILAMSSKVFKALFSRKFAEGQAGAGRSSERPHEIVVKDSPIPLRNLCLLLHHGIPVEDDQDYMPPASLLELGLMADKYDVVGAIRLPVCTLINDTGGKIDMDDAGELNRLVAATVLLDQAAAFRYFTQQLVLRRPTIQAGQFGRKCLDHFPPKLLGSLFCQQSIARQEFTAQVTALIDQFSKASEVADSESDVQKLLEHLNKLDLMPLKFRDHSLQELLDQLGGVRIPLMSTRETVTRAKPCKGAIVYREISHALSPFGDHWGESRRRMRQGSTGSLHSYTTEYEDVQINAPTHITIASSVEKIKEMCVGICLDCIQDKRCRLRHTHYWLDKGEFEGVKINEENWGEVESKIDIVNEADFPGYWDEAW